MSSSISAHMRQVTALIGDRDLSAHVVRVEAVPNSEADSAACNVEVGMLEDLRGFLEWARFLQAQTVAVERRKVDSIFTVTGVHESINWVVTVHFSKRYTPTRQRFPGITVEFERRRIGNAISNRGTITVAQLEVLLDRVGA